MYVLPVPTPKCALLFPIVHKSNKAIINNFLLKLMRAFMTHFLDIYLESTKAVLEKRNSNPALKKKYPLASNKICRRMLKASN